MPSSGIFISYRREDAAGHAGWLSDGLSAHFGEDQVFMDLGLEPGVDFVEQIEAGISAALLVVIGPEWLTTTGADGRRRLDDEGDFVRLEVATALARPGLRVVPILVHDARMPVAKELPEDLEPLARRQAIELTDERWKFDVGRLIGTLERVLATHAASHRSAAGFGSCDELAASVAVAVQRASEEKLERERESYMDEHSWVGKRQWWSGLDLSRLLQEHPRMSVVAPPVRRTA